ncbi:hypothetical protein LDENG_00060430 [Lucifuga dentata]|nr:hypothetical protein LDENG_00060430 [Lucifuga dentata]
MRKRIMGVSHSSGPDLSSVSRQNRDMPVAASRNVRRRESRDGKGEALAFSCSTQQFTGEIPALPQEIVEEIFLNLPPSQVVHNCRLVCREWKEIVDSESLWIERCRREGYHSHNGSKRPEDWRLFYFLCKKRRNLLKNPKAEENLRGWKILENGGDRWKVEGVMVPHPDDTVQKVFVTSYGMCMKSQLIDLEKEDYNSSFMDQFQPDIKISEWYAPRWDCGCKYHIRVELLDHRKKPIQTFAPETIYFEQWNDQKWNQMTHVFQNYGPGVRYIQFIHGGKDTQFWAGWYGIRVTDSRVEICPSKDL